MHFSGRFCTCRVLHLVVWVLTAIHHGGAAKNRSRPRLGQATAAHWCDRQPAEPAAEAASGRPRADLQRASRQGTRSGVQPPGRTQRPARDGGVSASWAPRPARHCWPTRSAEEIARLAQEIPSDDAAALIDYLPEELSAAVLDLMRPKESGVVENLLEYDEQTAGRIMNPNVFALTEDMTVGEAITALQTSRDVEMVFYLYVVDERRHLVGVVSLRRLLLVSPETPLKRIMTADLISARVDMDQEEVARQVASYNLLAIPGRRRGEQARRRHHRRRRHRRHQGRGHRRHLSGWPACPSDERVFTPAARSRCGSGCRGSVVNLGDRVPGRGGRRTVRGDDRAGHRAGGVHADRRRHGRQRRDADAHGDRARHRARRTDAGAIPARRWSKEALVGIGNGVVLGLRRRRAWRG